MYRYTMESLELVVAKFSWFIWVSFTNKLIYLSNLQMYVQANSWQLAQKKMIKQY